MGNYKNINQLVKNDIIYYYSTSVLTICPLAEDISESCNYVKILGDGHLFFSPGLDKACSCNTSSWSAMFSTNFPQLIHAINERCGKIRMIRIFLDKKPIVLNCDEINSSIIKRLFHLTKTKELCAIINFKKPIHLE